MHATSQVQEANSQVQEANSQVQEAIVRLVPGGEHSLSHLADDELLNSTRRLVGASNKLLSQLLLQLAEVATRGIHRTRACSSLYTYCIYELRMSEDAAARRSSAARLVKRFPLVFDAIASGELHLTGLLMLGPHLTPENHVQVLARAKFRTKRELAKLVRELHPLPQVPDRMEPLGPEPPKSLRAPTWQQWVTSLCPPVRELTGGDSPRDWANDAVQDVGAQAALTGINATSAALARCDAESVAAPARCDAESVAAPARCDAEAGAALARCDAEAGAALARCAEESGAALARCAEESGAALARCDAESGAALAHRELPPITAPQQYRMQFTTTEEHVRLVERAQALLARSSPGVSLGELHLQAMQLLVDRLEKERFAVVKGAKRGTPEHLFEAPPRGIDQPGQAEPVASSEQLSSSTAWGVTACPEPACGDHGLLARPRSEPWVQQAQPGATPRQRVGESHESPRMAPQELRHRGRHVPSAVKREVFACDGGGCSYVDERGQRCGETRYLELHHLKPFAQGGEHIVSNLALRCASHNALAAEADFGRHLIHQKRRSARHDSPSAEALSAEAHSAQFPRPR